MSHQFRGINAMRKLDQEIARKNNDNRIEKLEAENATLTTRIAELEGALKKAQTYIENGSALPIMNNDPYWDVSKIVEKALAGKVES